MMDHLFEISKIESPIERLFASAWIDFATNQSFPASLVRFSSDISDYDDIPEVTPIGPLHPAQLDVIIPQQKIGVYKADFVLIRFAYDVDLNTKPEFTEFLHRLPPVVVECDGHEFHQRTKEQAAHDKSRDRYMTSIGYRVMRFTGSELHRNASKCAKDVDNLFECLLRPWNADIIMDLAKQ